MESIDHSRHGGGKAEERRRPKFVCGISPLERSVLLLCRNPFVASPSTNKSGNNCRRIEEDAVEAQDD
jgi:hypothetical protein